MKVKSRSILQYFWPALSNNRSWKPIFGLFLSGCLRQVLLYYTFKRADNKCLYQTVCMHRLVCFFVVSGLENSTHPLVFTSALGWRASENFDISSKNYIFPLYDNNFCDAGPVPILRDLEACVCMHQKQIFLWVAFLCNRCYACYIVHSLNRKTDDWLTKRTYSPT